MWNAAVTRLRLNEVFLFDPVLHRQKEFPNVCVFLPQSYDSLLPHWARVANAEEPRALHQLVMGSQSKNYCLLKSM